MILDEPTTALGVDQSKRFMDYLKSLKEQNLSTIIITHDLHQAFNLADKFLFLRGGKRQKELLRSDISSIDELYKAFYE